MAHDNRGHPPFDYNEDGITLKVTSAETVIPFLPRNALGPHCANSGIKWYYDIALESSASTAVATATD